MKIETTRKIIKQRELTKRGSRKKKKKVISWEIYRLTKQYVAIGPAPNPVIHIILMLIFY